MSRRDMESRLDELEKNLAILAELVGNGRASHTLAPGSNPALDIARAYQPLDSEPALPPEPAEMCLRKRKSDQDDEGEVCVLGKGHDGGHAYSYPPKAAAVQAP